MSRHIYVLTTLPLDMFRIVSNNNFMLMKQLWRECLARVHILRMTAFSRAFKMRSFIAHPISNKRKRSGHAKHALADGEIQWFMVKLALSHTNGEESANLRICVHHFFLWNIGWCRNCREMQTWRLALDNNWLLRIFGAFISFAHRWSSTGADACRPRREKWWESRRRDGTDPKRKENTIIFSIDYYWKGALNWFC